MKSIRKKTILLLSFLPLFIIGCGEPSMNVSGSYESLQRCLAAIELGSGQSLKIVIDEPEKVTGRLENGKFFGCVQEKSGTRGTYWDGWYGVDS